MCKFTMGIYCLLDKVSLRLSMFDPILLTVCECLPVNPKCVSMNQLGYKIYWSLTVFMAYKILGRCLIFCKCLISCNNPSDHSEHGHRTQADILWCLQRACCLTLGACGLLDGDSVRRIGFFLMLLKCSC